MDPIENIVDGILQPYFHSGKVPTFEQLIKHYYDLVGARHMKRKKRKLQVACILSLMATIYPVEYMKFAGQRIRCLQA